MKGPREHPGVWALSAVLVTLVALVALVAVGPVPQGWATGKPVPAGAGARASGPPVGAAGPLTVVGLGDSVPAASECDCTSYVTLVAQQLAEREGSTAQIVNDASSGLTSVGLLAQLQDPAVRAALGHADVVIVTIGANDFNESDLTASACAPQTELSCYTDTLSTLRQDLAGILDDVTHDLPAGGQIVVTGYWNDFLDGRVGQEQGATYVAASKALTVASNRVTASVSAAENARYVDVYTAFKGAAGSLDCTALLTEDGDHPDAAGHQVIADTILKNLGS